MSKFKKVIYITLGGAFGGMIGTILVGVISTIYHYFCIMLTDLGAVWGKSAFYSSVVMGIIIGLGVSLGDILTPNRNKLIKVLVQIVVIGFISFTYGIFNAIISGKGIICPYFFMAVLSYPMWGLGASIGKETTKRIASSSRRILLGTVVSILVTALFFSPAEVLVLNKVGYPLMSGSIGFGVILFSSLFNKKRK